MTYEKRTTRYDMTYPGTMTDVYELSTPTYQTITEYAAAVGVIPRTVQRWLKADELPGAYQDEKGWWLIPTGTIRTPTSSGVVSVLPHPAPAAHIDQLPSFLTLDQAAELLAPVTRYAIKHNQKYYGVVKHGRHGSLVVPLSKIKQIRGI